MSKFVPKFKVGDMVRLNHRAPKYAAHEVKPESKVIRVENVRIRTHLMYFLKGELGDIGFYSDELDHVTQPVEAPKPKLSHIGRDAKGRFCKMPKYGQGEPNVDFDANVYDSSLIAKVKFERKRVDSNGREFGTLSISFVSSPETHYVYYDVPSNTAHGLWNAVSKGRFYHENIKGKFISDVLR